jgi:hypothetical protein
VLARDPRVGAAALRANLGKPFEHNASLENVAARLVAVNKRVMALLPGYLNGGRPGTARY